MMCLFGKKNVYMGELVERIVYVIKLSRTNTELARFELKFNSNLIELNTLCSGPT